MTPQLEFFILMVALLGSVISLACTIGYMLSRKPLPDKGPKGADEAFRDLKRRMDEWR